MKENPKIKKKSLKESIASIQESIEQAKLDGDTKSLKMLKIILKRLESFGVEGRKPCRRF